jgi:uncharacterized protein YyaL (SSP411 family)
MTYSYSKEKINEVLRDDRKLLILSEDIFNETFKEKNHRLSKRKKKPLKRSLNRKSKLLILPEADKTIHNIESQKDDPYKDENELTKVSNNQKMDKVIFFQYNPFLEVYY